MSALRAGFRPHCADLFADRDLQTICPVLRVPSDRYPAGFAKLVEQDTPGPWMYTGALENRPDFIREMVSHRQLWGASAESLFKVRDPHWVSQALKSLGLPYPELASNLSMVDKKRKWIVKPLHSAGGRGIMIWSGEPFPKGMFLQELIPGQPCSAVFIASRNGARLLGVTEQLIGELALGAAPFFYCGSIGPLRLNGHAESILRKVGSTLAMKTELQGIFGVDFILQDDVPWVVEVNPRYTASVEILEFAAGIKALAWNSQAFTKGVRPPEPSFGDARIHGKAILFAKKDLLFPHDGPWTPSLKADRDLTEMPDYADIPAAGESISEGKPILTVFSKADSRDACWENLKEMVQDLDRWLFSR
jgi:predicted ATP-grasp superfamily ATP-dependent carboligase